MSGNLEKFVVGVEKELGVSVTEPTVGQKLPTFWQKARKVISEWIGLAVLVAAYSVAILIRDAYPELSFGLALFVFGYIVGCVSGAHRAWKL